MQGKRDAIIGWSELLGGIAGLVVLLPIAALQGIVHLGLIYYAGAALGFLAAILAGERLVRGKPRGSELSLVIQALQVLQFTAAGWMFQYATGIQVLLKVGPSLFQVSPGVNAAVWCGPTLVATPWMVGVNLFAVWATVHLAREVATKRAESARAPCAPEAAPGGRTQSNRTA